MRRNRIYFGHMRESHATHETHDTQWPCPTSKSAGHFTTSMCSSSPGCPLHLEPTAMVTVNERLVCCSWKPHSTEPRCSCWGPVLSSAIGASLLQRRQKSLPFIQHEILNRALDSLVSNTHAPSSSTEMCVGVHVCVCVRVCVCVCVCECVRWCPCASKEERVSVFSLKTSVHLLLRTVGINMADFRWWLKAPGATGDVCCALASTLQARLVWLSQGDTHTSEGCACQEAALLCSGRKHAVVELVSSDLQPTSHYRCCIQLWFHLQDAAILYWYPDMRLDIVLDFGYPVLVIWLSVVFSWLHYSDVIFRTYQTENTHSTQFIIHTWV